MAAITHYIGKYQLYRFEILDADNANVDVSTATDISFTIKAAVTDEDASILLEKTLADGVSVVTVNSRKFVDVVIDEDGDDTDGLTPGDKVYDLQIVTSTGIPKLVAKDTFTLAYPVKRAVPS